MSLPWGESADDPAMNGIDHRNSKKEAFLMGITGEEAVIVFGRVRLDRKVV